MLFFLVQPISNLLGDQRGVAVGAVVDDQVDMELVLLGLVYNLDRVLDHLRSSRAGTFFSKGNSPLAKRILTPYVNLRAAITSEGNKICW